MYRKKLKIKGRESDVPIIQGGMGVGVSLSPLASSVALEGGIGVISSAGLDRLISKQLGREVNIYEAVFFEVKKAKELSNDGLIGVNIMVFLEQDRDAAARGAIDAGVDFIFSGAGLPLDLPAKKNLSHTALIPIVSSAQALRIICKRWERFNYRPDAVVLEGPKAGGHLGFKFSQINKPENRLENLLPQIQEVAFNYGNMPVIVAGGIYDRYDIQRFIDLGADGVQMGTRFLATSESTAPLSYKLAVIRARESDIIVVANSPCGFPFRTLINAPMYQALIENKMHNVCDMGYLLQKDKDGKNTICLAKNDPKKYFCICKGLLSSAGYFSGQDLYTVGSEAWRVKEIVPTKKVMNELKGLV